MQKGISLQATYQYGHSIDNASSIGGGSQTVAQNDQDLNAEEGNSSFDIRHKLTGNWVFELPFGPNRAFLYEGRLLVEGDWMGSRSRATSPLPPGRTTRRTIS